MDTDSLKEFQNPAATFDNSVEINNITDELKGNEVVSNPHIPNLDATPTTNEPEIGPYGKLIRTGPSPEELKIAAEKEERNHIISRLMRLNSKPNFPNITFNEGDSLHTLRRLNRLATHTGRLKMTISFMKRATIFLCRLVEGFCNRFPVTKKYGLNLDGFSESLLLSINTYDSILEDIYEHYSDVIVECSPLLIYIGSIGSQALVYSATKTIMDRTNRIKQERMEAEQKKRDQEIAELMRARFAGQKKASSMSGPSGVIPSSNQSAGSVDPNELEDYASAGFASVTTEAESPKRNVRFKENTQVMSDSKEKAKSDRLVVE